LISGYNIKVMKWKEIPSLPLYEVSREGHVRPKKRIVKFGLQNRPVGGKPLSPKTKTNGYQELSLTVAVNVRKSFYVHRLVAETWIGPIPPKLTVNHKDGNKKNNHVDNLEIVTQAENNRHGRENGLIKPMEGLPGSKHPRAKTTEEEVLKIRSEHAKHKSIVALMNDYPHLSKGLLTKVVYRQSWKHV